MSMSKEELMALAQKFDSRKGRRPRAPAPPTPALASKSDIEAAARLYDERLARASAYARARRRNGRGQNTMWELSQSQQQQQTPQQVAVGMNSEQMQAAINAAEQASVNAQQDAMNAQQDVMSAQQEVHAAINAQHSAMNADQIHEHDVQVGQETNAESVPQEASDDVVEALHQHVPETEAEQSAAPEVAPEVAPETAQDNGQEVVEGDTADGVPETTTDDVPAPAPGVQEAVSHEVEIAVPLDVSEAPESGRHPAIPAEVAEKVEQVLTSTLNYTPRIAAKYFDTAIARPFPFKRSTPAASDQSPKKAKTED